MKELTICPNCQSNWGFEEVSFQNCDCCGYPNNGDEDDYFDDYDNDNDDECIDVDYYDIPKDKKEGDCQFFESI